METLWKGSPLPEIIDQRLRAILAKIEMSDEKRQSCLHLWGKLVQGDGEHVVDGSDEANRSPMVTLQGAVERTFAELLKEGKIASAFGVIHTPLPATPCRTKADEIPKNLADQRVTDHPPSWETVLFRPKIVRQFADAGGQLVSMYSETESEKALERERNEDSNGPRMTEKSLNTFKDLIHAYEQPPHSNNLREHKIQGSVDNRHSGATYIIKGKDGEEAFAFSMRSYQAHSPTDGTWGMWAGDLRKKQAVWSRVQNMNEYFESNGLNEMRSHIPASIEEHYFKAFIASSNSRNSFTTFLQSTQHPGSHRERFSAYGQPSLQELKKNYSTFPWSKEIESEAQDEAKRVDLLGKYMGTHRETPLVSSLAAAQTLDAYKKDPVQARIPVNGAAGRIAWQAFDEFLRQPQIQHVIFLTNGPGHGKSSWSNEVTALLNKTHGEQLTRGEILCVDSTFSGNPDREFQHIHDAISAGKKVTVAAPVRPIEDVMETRVKKSLDPEKGPTECVRVEQIPHLSHQAMENYLDAARKPDFAARVTFLAMDGKGTKSPDRSLMEHSQILEGANAVSFLNQQYRRLSSVMNPLLRSGYAYAEHRYVHQAATLSSELVSRVFGHGYTPRVLEQRASHQRTQANRSALIRS